MWRQGEFWSIKNDNSFRLKTASAQLDVFNRVRRAKETKRDSSLSVLPHENRAREETGTLACGRQVPLGMTVQVESEIRKKMRELYERTGEIVA